jgi:hypothetical protein
VKTLSGEFVRIEVPSDGCVLRGRVSSERIDTAICDVTVGGLFPDGPPPDTSRQTLPGKMRRVVTIEIED